MMTSFFVKRDACFLIIYEAARLVNLGGPNTRRMLG